MAHLALHRLEIGTVACFFCGEDHILIAKDGHYMDGTGDWDCLCPTCETQWFTTPLINDDYY